MILYSIRFNRSSKSLASLALAAMIATGCGSSGEPDVESTDPVADPPADEPAVADPPADDDAQSADAPSDEPPVNPDPVGVELRTGELVIEQAVLAPGSINFEASNHEEGPHIFAIARGDSYEALPKLSNGAVDREALGEDFITKTGLLMAGLGNVRLVSVDLAPGTYVLYCNGGDDEDEIAHAAHGEALTVTVVE